VALRILAAALGLALCACSDGRTQILIEVDSELLVPDRLDEIAIAAEGPDGRTQRASARLGPGELPLPRTLGMVHEDGPLGPYTVTVTGRRAEAEVVRRTGTLTFQAGRTLVWRVTLLEACVGVSCEAGQTCAAGGCRSAEVLPGELDEWDGTPPPQDAGAYDACVPDERCNGVDDDCDGATDEDFDTQTDPEHCGACGNACAAANATPSCAEGTCVIDACDPGFGDCDGVPSNGCETDTTSSAAHCGGCGMACTPPERECCSGSCARGC
jgi:hypothetical protein